MNFLLDTHVFLWALGDSQRLKPEAAAAIRDPRNAVFVSAITSVEVAIKSALGKLEAPLDLEDEIILRGFSHLPLHFKHGAALRALPQHHQDPFDRMLIAQAIEEKLTIITHDRKFELYSVSIRWT
ncbi:MAG: type II toxin-antitoxin system VapC family toxin [Opitutales bacterium]